MSFVGAIFDLDGVLVDTVPLHFEAWQRMFDHYGYAFDHRAYKEKVDGRKREDGARAIMTDASAETIAEAAVLKQTIYLDLIEQGRLTAFPSSIDLVRDLAARGVKVAVASSSRNVRVILDKIGLMDAVSAVVNGGDLTHGKPHPEIFLTAAEELGLGTAQCVVFEDAKAGIEAAKAGGFFCVGIDRGEHPQDLAGADLVVKDLAEIDFAALNSA